MWHWRELAAAHLQPCRAGTHVCSPGAAPACSGGLCCKFRWVIQTASPNMQALPLPASPLLTWRHPCLLLQVSVPDHDSITISYSGPPGAPGNTISLMSCYTNSSAANRAWRKANAVINVSGAAQPCQGLLSRARDCRAVQAGGRPLVSDRVTCPACVLLRPPLQAAPPAVAHSRATSANDVPRFPFFPTAEGQAVQHWRGHPRQAVCHRPAHRLWLLQVDPRPQHPALQLLHPGGGAWQGGPEYVLPPGRPRT